MEEDTKPSKQEKESKKHVIDFGKFYENLSSEEGAKKLHELTEEEKQLLIEDFKAVREVEKEEESEIIATKHFEERLKELIDSIVYLDGYIQQIEDGNSMLKINNSVKELGEKLVASMQEVEKLSTSMLDEDKKRSGLAKHINQVLSKAKKYHEILFS